MTQESQFSRPEAMYDRSLNNETDLYVVYAGKDSKYGPIALRHIEIEPGAKLSQTDTSIFEAYDPQAPHLLTYEELAVNSLGYNTLVRQIASRETIEFEALIGISASTSTSTATAA